jgi:D-glycero-alpha-D-manno-heptose-7-phosphate kinase
MLIARAPVRISFAGGGTDLAGYYSRFGGTVISASINKYLYVILSPSQHNSLQLISADYQALFSFGQEQQTTSLRKKETELALPKAVLEHFGIKQGLSIFMASEIPPGTGLGSSSAAAVGLSKALATYSGQKLSKQELAELASFIEIEKLGMPIGKQDQYASAFGGLNQLDFFPNGAVQVTPLNLSDEVVGILQSRLMLFYTGVSRYSSVILEKQKTSVQHSEKEVLHRLHLIKELALGVKETLQKGDLNTFGELLHEGWLQKKHLTNNITNAQIDEIYETARQAGASGGKITGAGGGGFLLLYCLPEHQGEVTMALQTRDLQRLYFSLEQKGAHILLNDPDNIGISSLSTLL